MPYSIRTLLESAVRNCDNFQVTTNDVENILNWETNQTNENGIEVAFKPARVILQVRRNKIVKITFFICIITLFSSSKGLYWSSRCC